MPNVVIRWFWVFLVGWWLTPICFLIGYLLIAFVITAPKGFWIFERLVIVYSLNNTLGERGLVYPNNIASIIWFYIAGWWIGVAVIVMAVFFALLIISFRMSERIIHQIDAAVIAD